MNKRTNAGYTIIANIALPDCEYVLGEKQTESKEPKYVTWYCVNNENYYYGYYTKGNSLEVGKASTTAVVVSSIMIMIFNLLLTQLMR